MCPGVFDTQRYFAMIRRCLLCLVLLALAGCQPSANPVDGPGASAGVGPSQVVARGELRFIRGYTDGWRVAQGRRVPCMLFFTADWCAFCKQMEQTTFRDPAVAQLAEQFVCILVDADREESVCRRFRVSGYPTIHFVSPVQGALHRVVGRQSPVELAEAMRAALDRVALFDGDDLPITR